MHRVFLSTILRANDHWPLISAAGAFVCEHHGNFISHNASFKMPTERPIKMIETGKHSAFRGTICNKHYTMHRVFLSTVLRASDIFLVNISR